MIFIYNVIYLYYQKKKEANKIINIYYWFVNKESGEDFFVEVKSTNTRGDDYSNGIAWQIAKCNFGDNISFIDIVDGETAERYGSDIY